MDSPPSNWGFSSQNEVHNRDFNFLNERINNLRCWPLSCIVDDAQVTKAFLGQRAGAMACAPLDFGIGPLENPFSSRPRMQARV
jgi:hypothetical protein